MKQIFILFVVFSINANAQTGIGTSTPNASAKLEVAATDKGFLLPRMTAAQRGLIPSPLQVCWCIKRMWKQVFM